MNEFHLPVMLDESIHYLAPAPGRVYIDCTLGGAGHTEELLKLTAPDGKVMGIDLDPLAIETARQATRIYGARAILVRDNFKNLKEIAKDNNIGKVDGVLLDLGLSSGQLRDQKRGFSFLAQGWLDMRFGQQTEITAEKLINTSKEEELVEIFKEFGEERLARPIAKAIIALRREQPITQPAQLVTVIAGVYSRFFGNKSKTNPATKIFQALRIAVNRELDNLKKVLPAAISLLKPDGRLVVISYHSLEDRIVKEYFKGEARDCVCAPTMPVCQCHHKRSVKILTNKPIEPTAEEVLNNPRSRSAKMRVAQKI